MEITGKIILALDPVSGTSKNGNPWKKREYVLETQESFPRKIFFDFFGDRADQFPLQPGQNVKLSFDIESREYNGKWFTSIRGWKAEVLENQGVISTTTPPLENDFPMADNPFKNSDPTDDLPF